MTWEVLESVSVPSRNGFTEDRAGWSGSSAWILDGASAVTGHRRALDVASDALWLVEHLDRALNAVARAGDLPVEQMVSQAIAAAAERAKREWDRVPDVPPSAALGIIQRQGDRTDYLVLADVSVILRTASGVWEITDQRVDDCTEPTFRRLRALLAGGCDFEEARTLILPELAEHRRADMNTSGGYWVASFDECAVDQAIRGSELDVIEVILATDGFMRALRPFHLIGSVGSLFEPGVSLADLAGKVRAHERADRGALTFPRWSTHDDICATRLRWS